MPLTQFMQKQLLDFVLGGGGVVSAPAARWVQFATANPRSDSAFDGPIRSRLSVSFNSAASPAGSVSNGLATTGSLTAATLAATCTGWNLYDASVGGNRIAYGTLATTFSLASGTADQIALAAGAMRITLS